VIHILVNFVPDGRLVIVDFRECKHKHQLT